MLKLCNSVAKIMKQWYKETIILTLLHLDTSKGYRFSLTIIRLFSIAHFSDVFIQRNSKFLLKFVTSPPSGCNFYVYIHNGQKLFVTLQINTFYKKTELLNAADYKLQSFSVNLIFRSSTKRFLWFPDTASTKCFYR